MRSHSVLQPAFLPRWNFYRCKTCHGFWVTVEVDDGTVPTQVACKVGPTCTGTMMSAGHPKPENWPDIVPRAPHAEWYRPRAKELKLMRKKYRALADYVARGGLVLRQCNTVTPQFPVIEEKPVS